MASRIVALRFSTRHATLTRSIASPVLKTTHLNRPIPATLTSSGTRFVQVASHTRAWEEEVKNAGAGAEAHVDSVPRDPKEHFAAWVEDVKDAADAGEAHVDNVPRGAKEHVAAWVEEIKEATEAGEAHVDNVPRGPTEHVAVWVEEVTDAAAADEAHTDDGTIVKSKTAHIAEWTDDVKAAASTEEAHIDNLSVGETAAAGAASLDQLDDESKNAAFLGEADSDDAFEADVEIYPEAHRHNFDDVSASGLHGQAGELDEPIERVRKLEALDASRSAFLGEADSSDAHEVDRELYPEKYRHNIQDASNAAYLGEADSDDAHEMDRAANPQKYSHNIDDARPSGLHGQAGEGDEPVERNR